MSGVDAVNLVRRATQGNKRAEVKTQQSVDSGSSRHHTTGLAFVFTAVLQTACASMGLLIKELEERGLEKVQRALYL